MFLKQKEIIIQVSMDNIQNSLIMIFKKYYAKVA